MTASNFDDIKQATLVKAIVAILAIQQATVVGHGIEDADGNVNLKALG